MSYFLTLSLLFILGKCTLFRPVKKQAEESDIIDIFITNLQETDQNHFVIKEKTPQASFSQFMAHLLLIQHPKNVFVEVFTSKNQNKNQIEETLKNMNFHFFQVTTAI